MDLIADRLRNQKLTGRQAASPHEIVAWMGAMQAQDYAGARWAIGQRVPGVTDADVQRAFDAGAILRTHVLRPTWHFVAPEDIRWILALSAPRVHAANAFVYRQTALDAGVFRKSRKVIEKALSGGNWLTRDEIGELLGRAGVEATGLRLAALMMHAELEAVVCSGPRRGRQFTYALLDERAPRTKTPTMDEALAALVQRYYTSHGPATVRDCAWWSGLTMRQVDTGLASLGSDMAKETIGSRVWWWRSGRRSSAPAAPAAFLLPNYDEYLIAFKDRDTAVAETRLATRPHGAPDPFSHHLIVDGRLEGSWRRTVSAGTVRIEVATYRRLARQASESVDAASERLGKFLGLEVDLRIVRAATHT